MARTRVIELIADADSAIDDIKRLDAGIEGISASVKEARSGLRDLGDTGASEALSEIQNLDAGIAEISDTAKKARSDLRSMGAASKSLDETGESMEDVADKSLTMRSSVSASANNLGFEMVQATQDAKFGMAGVANQIPLMTEQFTQLQAKTGSTSGALGALASQMMGPVGIIGAVTLLLTYSDDIVSFFSDSGDAAEEASNQFEGFFETVEDGIPSLENLQEDLEEIGTIDLELAPAGGAGPGGGAAAQQLRTSLEDIRNFREALGRSNATSQFLQHTLRELGVDVRTVLTGSFEEARGELTRFRSEINRVVSDVEGAIGDQPGAFARAIQSQLRDMRERGAALTELGFRSQEDVLQNQVDFLEDALIKAQDLAGTPQEFFANFSGLRQRFLRLQERLEALREEGEKAGDAISDIEPPEALSPQDIIARQFPIASGIAELAAQERERREKLKEIAEGIVGGAPEQEIAGGGRFDELASQLARAIKARDLGFKQKGREMGQSVIEAARNALIRGEISREEFRTFARTAREEGLVETSSEIGQNLERAADVFASGMSQAAISLAEGADSAKVMNQVLKEAAKTLTNMIIKRGVLAILNVISGGTAGTAVGAGEQVITGGGGPSLAATRSVSFGTAGTAALTSAEAASVNLSVGGTIRSDMETLAVNIGDNRGFTGP